MGHCGGCQCCLPVSGLRGLSLVVPAFSLFSDLALVLYELLLDAAAGFHCLSLEYPLDTGLGSASIHGHPRSSLGATLGVRMSVTAYGNLSTVSSVGPIGASRLNLRPRHLSI